MKVLMFGLLMAGVSALFDQPATTTPQAVTTTDGHNRVIVMSTGTDSNGSPMIVETLGDTAHAYAFVGADGVVAMGDPAGQNVLVETIELQGTGTADGTRHVVHMRHMGNDPDAANRGWLGVSIGSVPEAVAAQLNVEADGVMILNVVEGSPADNAGLLAHDIILSVAGENVEGNVARTTEIIREQAPGDVVPVVVLREGQAHNLNITLGARSEMGAAAWKFRLAPGEVEEHVRTHGRMLRKDANGNWVMKDLGELADLSQLPAQIQAFIPQAGNRTVEVTISNGEKNVSISVERDGTTIEVAQAGDGPINVTRTDASGVETTATYATRDELAAADAEAADIFGTTDQTIVMQLDGDGTLGDNLNFTFDTDIDVEGLHENMMQWHQEFQDNLGAAGESYRQAMDEIREAVERIKEEHGIDGNAFGFLMGHGFGTPPAPGTPPVPPVPHVRMFGQVRQSFEVRPDGTIESKVRRGDTEVIDLFTNEADLQQRDPQLYQKFIETRNAEH